MRGSILPASPTSSSPSECLELDCLPIDGEQVSRKVNWSREAEETLPLLTPPSSSRAPTPPLLRYDTSLRGIREQDILIGYNERENTRSPARPPPTRPSAMEKIRKSSVAQTVDRLAVKSEPGLTNAQLMLTNFDLKPGKPSNPSQHWEQKKLIHTYSRAGTSEMGTVEFCGLLDCGFL